MSEDRFTSVSSQSWFSRIGDSIKGILFGGILFLVAFPLLFWNEGRAVKRQKTLQEGAGSVVSVSADRVDPQNEGKLVHVSGRAVTGETLSDPKFGVSVAALKLRRNAEMYQWKERSESRTEKKLGGGTETVTEYTYDKTWSERPIESSAFKHAEGHQNPRAMAYSSDEFVAKEIKVGAFVLPAFFVSQIGNFSPLAVPEVPELPEGAKLHGDEIYAGADPAAPAVGDVRVSFEAALPADFSLVAQQAGGSFVQYSSKAGGSLALLEAGINDAAAMFQQAEASNIALTWVLRLAGFVVMGFGLSLVLRPVAVLADVVPFIGTIVGAGTGFIAFMVAALFSLITIAIAWVVYRPLIGIALLAGGGVILFLIIGRMRKANAAGAAPAAGAAA